MFAERDNLTWPLFAFHRFKDHKKCNYMIANALAADNSFTPAQVSRKLKQLGLRVPRQKRSKADVNLRDEELNDISTGEGRDSDDETLLSIRNRYLHVFDLAFFLRIIFCVLFKLCSIVGINLRLKVVLVLGYAL